VEFGDHGDSGRFDSRCERERTVPRVDTDREISQRSAIPESADRRRKAINQAYQTADSGVRGARSATKFERGTVSTGRDPTTVKCDGIGSLHRVR
jgi:hypothetical protein